MKLSESFFYTLRENAKDEESVSGNLLVRAGMIKKTSNGIYMIMPMGKLVLNKIENIKAKNYLKLKIESILLEKMVIYQSKDESEKNNF